MAEAKCNECGANIGGKQHIPLEGNIQFNTLVVSFSACM